MGALLVFLVFVAPIIFAFSVSFSFAAEIGFGISLIIVLTIPLLMLALPLAIVYFATNRKKYVAPYNPDADKWRPKQSVITEDYERQRIEYNKQHFSEYYKEEK